MKMNRTLAYGMASLKRLEELGKERSWVQVVDLARAERLPPAYLNKVLQALVHNGMIKSARGRGYRLARPLSKINVWEIMEAFTMNGAPQKRRPDISLKLYATLKSQVSTWLEGLTLEDIVRSTMSEAGE